MAESLFSRLSADAARVTELAAIAAVRLAGRGDEKAADQVAVDAMRTALNELDIAGRIVIGEGERDEAPMLYIGEEVGTGSGPQIDIALDPLEGTTLTAKAMANALAVLAMAPRGGLLHAPDTYMDKIAVGPGYAPGVVDLDASPEDNVKALAKAKGVAPRDITVCVMDRPRHADLIAALRRVEAKVVLITDGDVAAVWITPATSPSVIRTTLASTRRRAAIRSAWRGRSMTQTVMSRGSTPLAEASERTLSCGFMSRSTVPGA